MSGGFIYTVRGRFRDESVAQEWVRWLADGHLDEVRAGGATSAEVIRVDTANGAPEVLLEVRYRFPSREAFAAYERDHAPRLRAEGMARFPASRGVALERATADLIHESR